MIGIKDITTFLPANRINTIECADSLGSTPEQIQNRIGFVQLARMEKGQTLLDLALPAVSKLLKKNNIQPADIEVLVVVTQNHDQKIPHASAHIHGMLQLSATCACFDIGLGCSGYVYALSIVSAFMSANALTKGVLVTADPYSNIVDPRDKATALIFGDGATATLLTDNPTFEIGKFVFGTDGSHADKIACNEGILHMNGRAVFNFSATVVPANIIATLEANNTLLEEVDQFVLHQGSRYIVDTIATRLRIDARKSPFMAANYGNTVSSSIPLMLAELAKVPSNRTLVLSGFGLGLSWASTVIKRKGTQ
ncbi:MAG: ketoacyl-ACP synthase III [Pusillimonas sp.]